MSMEMIERMNKENCKCGREHSFGSEVIIGEGAINRLPRITKKINAEKVFLLADKNTYEAAGKAVCEILESSGHKVEKYIFTDDIVEPDEKHVGLAVMNFKPDCDVVIGVGSGVINDIGKILSAAAQKKYIIVGTAPSMDGYASATSSMTMEGIKVSLPSKCAEVIVGDIDVLCKAPMKMMISGLGDMLAKYVSICEWRISNLINGEYYCEKVADMVRSALKKCTDNADGLMKRDKEAVRAVFEGLVIGGAAMKFAGLSRPASGVEHYISHIWDMRGAEFGTPVEFHGIQCALGTLIAVKLYEKLKNSEFDKEKAIKYVENFNYAVYAEALREFLGSSAEGMLALEEKEEKYSVKKHKERIETIIANREKIMDIIDSELPEYEQLEKLFDKLGLPKTPEEIGIDSKILPMTFRATKDIRDKYVLSRLCWDLGIIDELM